MSNLFQVGIVTTIAGLTVGPLASACSVDVPERQAVMAFAGYPSEAPLFRSVDGVVFSSGRVGGGQGEATGPISRDARLDVISWNGDLPVVFGLADIEQGYMSGVRGALVRREPDGGLERLGRGRFRKIWDADAATAPT